MAKARERLSSDQRVQRSVGRLVRTVLLVVVLLGALIGWASLGFYELAPGQASVVLVFGRYWDTTREEGLKWTLPPPIAQVQKLEAQQVRNEDFGFWGKEGQATDRPKLREATMQTSDNNIVWVPFAVQYRIKDPFKARYRIAKPDMVVRDAAQAAMREVVGRMTVDGVLREQRETVAIEAADVLQDILDGYESGIDVDGVQLQDVQPPAPVRESFDDVVAANQDANRLVNEAQAYQNEVIPRAEAEATELRQGAQAYRDSKIAQATGEASRFQAVVAEYRKAPEVTQKRLYLETMESVLPEVDKVIIERGTTNVLPYLPLGRQQERGGQ